MISKANKSTKDKKTKNLFLILIAAIQNNISNLYIFENQFVKKILNYEKHCNIFSHIKMAFSL